MSMRVCVLVVEGRGMNANDSQVSAVATEVLVVAVTMVAAVAAVVVDSLSDESENAARHLRVR